MNDQTRLAQGAVWFYWVAALSMLNAVLAASGQDWRMVMGMGLTEVLNTLPKVIAPHGPLEAGHIIFILASNLMLSGLVAGFGYLSLKGYTWIFIVGAVLYLLDSGILLLCQDWYSLAFHAYVLYKFFSGIKASFALKRPANPPPAAAAAESVA